MFPILFSLGPINFYSYGLFAAIALISGYLMMEKLAKRKNLPTDKLFANTLWVFLAAIVVARLMYFVLYFNQFQSIWQIFYIWQGGLVSFGGMLGALIVFIWLFRKNLWQWLDILAVSFLLGLFFWRIGCTLSGDHVAIYSNAWFAINHQIPITIFESLLGLAGFGLAYYVFKSIKLPAGIIFWSIFAYYGLLRIILDQWRLENTSFWSLHSGQLTGILMVVVAAIAIVVMILYDKTRKKDK